MDSLQELGEAVAKRRKALKYRQTFVADHAGITPETLSRFERGRIMEFGSRKLLAVLTVLGMEIRFEERGMAGSLDELRKERSADFEGFSEPPKLKPGRRIIGKD